MSDNLENRNGQDRRRINIHEDYELRDWSKKLGVSKDELKEAVKAVGSDAKKVQDHLTRSDRPSEKR